MDLHTIDQQISDIAKDINFYSYLTPTNQDEEKKKFFLSLDENKVYNPIELQKSIAKINPMFNLGIQNDSSESMIFLLDLFEQKILLEVFQNKFNSIRQCMKCKNKFERIETFNILSLDMSSSIKNSFDSFFETEDMDGKVECSHCKTKQDFKRTYEVDTLSDNLIIHMKRFQCINNKKYIKNSSSINIQDIIQLTDINYELRGIIIHKGRREGGHYYFVGKNLKNEWSIYDDRARYPSDINLKNYGKYGYIFLYEKIKN